jgi:glutamate N-acetyltransferase/amino-acid N-acetyltransferase
MVLVALEKAASVAAVFTKNAFCAAPVVVAREHLASGVSPQCLVINAGNANAGTGEQGIEDCRKVCEAVAASLQCEPQAVLPFSTGVIGELLPVEKMRAIIPGLSSSLAEDAWAAAANAILTTDTREKIASKQVDIDGVTVTLTGMAKGAGMIKPDMATLLVYLGTDACIEAGTLQSLLDEAVNISFNRITVDGDTSTNDACVLMASGKAGNQPITDTQSPEARDFYTALEEMMIFLATEVIRDAEGASKFITIKVNGGASAEECLKAGYAVAESPLVKTAMFASDANWGRILAAVGRSGIDGLDISGVSIRLGDVSLIENGNLSPGYSEDKGQSVMSKTDINVFIDLGRGDASETVWTSDLSHDYVRINAEYRT